MKALAKLALISLLLAGLSLNADRLKRLDPHGAADLDLKAKVDLKKRSECTACHSSGKQGLTLKADAENSCVGCHGKGPHSGTAEHMGRVHKGQLLNCLSCHSPHRADQKSWDKPLGFFAQPVTPDAPKGFSKSVNPRPMLKKTCTECHQW